MFAVYAAEQQYRHDTWARERDRALLASIRERGIAHAPRRATSITAAAPAVAAARSERAPWARPIGLHSGPECTTACAVA